MKTRLAARWVQIFLILVLIILFASGCASSKSGTAASKPPQIPPQSTFIMDFNDFLQDMNSFFPGQTPSTLWASALLTQVPAIISSQSIGDHANWGFAALNGGFWNLVGIAGLAIPEAAFVESIKQTPIKQPDNSWIWIYSITVQGVTYTAELRGKHTDSGIRWDMYITKEKEYSDFLWYYGESSRDASQGYWVMNDKPSKPNDLLRIDWHRNPTGETGDIKYTNIVPGGPENGGFISYTVFKKD